MDVRLPLYPGSSLSTVCLRPAAWSAPSAIGTAGLGVGTQAGAEMTDFLIVLNTQSVSTPCPPNTP